MKQQLAIIVTALTLGAALTHINAQDQDQAPRRHRPPMDQDGGRGPGRGPRPPLPPLVVALDVNTNGVIEATEIANAPNALATLDKNGDHQLTRDELRPPRPEGAPEGHRPPPPEDAQAGGDNTNPPADSAQRPARPVPPIIAALDVNKDGVIDANEMVNSANALLTLDKNGDGQLTDDEIRPPRPEGDRGPRGPRGPRGDHRGPRPEPPQDQQ